MIPLNYREINSQDRLYLSNLDQNHNRDILPDKIITPVETNPPKSRDMEDFNREFFE